MNPEDSLPREMSFEQKREAEVYETWKTRQQVARSELRDKGWAHSLRKAGRAAAFATGILLSSLGLSDAVLPDDPAVLSRFPPIVSVLTNHEGDPLETTLVGIGIMVPGLVGSRKAKRDSSKKGAND
jgi:hypothetical protein